VAFSMAWLAAQVDGKTGDDRARGLLAAFRGELYRCFATYRDALLELADAVLCKQDRVHMLAELSLEPECRRGHGGVYGAVNGGRVDIARLRRSLAGLPVPAWDDGRIRLTADVSNWLRPDAATSPDRLFCHCYAQGRGNAQMIPGWPYSVIAALEPGRTSWPQAFSVNGGLGRCRLRRGCELGFCGFVAGGGCCGGAPDGCGRPGCAARAR